MKSKLIFTSLLATALITPGQASAQCTINSSRLQQVSEREILAIIDGYCTKENGETGYYTEIAPDTYGEVMAVYGHRNIDQYGHGFESRYGFNIVFSDSKASYEAGVWIGDTDGVTHSEFMNIANQFATTTTTPASSNQKEKQIEQPALPVNQSQTQPSTTIQESNETSHTSTTSSTMLTAVTTVPAVLNLVLNLEPTVIVEETTTKNATVIKPVKKAQIQKKLAVKKKLKGVSKK